MQLSVEGRFRLTSRASPENRNKKTPEGAHNFFAYMTQEREICEREHKKKKSRLLPSSLTLDGLSANDDDEDPAAPAANSTNAKWADG